MHQEKHSSRTYEKYINRKIWDQALTGNNQAEKLEEFFNSYHGKQNQLQMAIDNVNLKYFQDLLQFCLETLVFLSKKPNRQSCYYMEQILKSNHLRTLFFDELNIMEKKIYQTKDESSFQKFINYFLKIVEQSQNLQLQSLQQYINKLEETLIVLLRASNGFTQQFQQIQLLKRPKNNDLPRQYQPKNFEVDYKRDNFIAYKPPQIQNFQEINNPQFQQINIPQEQKISNSQNQLQENSIKEYTNRQQEYQPRNYFSDNNNHRVQQQEQQVYKYSPYSEPYQTQKTNEDDLFQTLQINSSSQILKNTYSNHQSKQQNIDQYRQNELIQNSMVYNNQSQIYQRVNQPSRKQNIESPYVEKQPSQINVNSNTSYINKNQYSKNQNFQPNNFSNSNQYSDNNQYSQNSNYQIKNSANSIQYSDNNQYSQNISYYQEQQDQHKKIQDYTLDTSYFDLMKNFYNQKLDLKQRKRLIQMDQVSISYKNCPIEPTVAEFEDIVDKNYVYGGDIFEIPFGQAYQSTELFINNHFFILREDYLKNFRIAVLKLKQSGFQDLSYQVLQNAFLYYNVLIENITVTNKGFQFIVTMNAYDPKNKSIDWRRSNRLMAGSLLLLSTVKLEFMLYGTVVEKPNSDKQGRISIAITLIELNMKEQLQFVNSLLSQEHQLIAIENKIYFETYIHFLSCLKTIDTSKFPFADQIIFGSKKMPLPGYLDKPQIIKEGIYYDIDLKFDLKQQKLIGQKQRVNILREWPNVNQESLDQSQLKAIQVILRNGISIIQGPPGTGKTFCGALGVRILLENQFKWNPDYQKKNKPILIVCQTNHALDQFLHHILSFCRMDDIVRIGGRCKMKEFEPMLLQTNQQQRKVKFRWDQFLSLRDDLDRKLRNLLNLSDNVQYKDVQTYVPELFNMIVDQYLETEDLNFCAPISNESKKMIVHMWLDHFKPRTEQADKIIAIENSSGNFLKRVQLQRERKQFKAIMVYKYTDLENQFQISEETRNQIQRDQEEDDVDENQNLDSDEEENRRILNTDENSGKSEFIDKLIKDQRTMKRLLNRLSKDNEASIQNLMKEINEKKRNYKIWEMQQTKRNLISKFIFSQKFKYLYNLLQNEVDEFDFQINQLKQLYIDRDIEYIQGKKIVGVTLSGCAKYAEKLQNLNFNILVIEEAGEVLESNLVAVLSQQINHLIMIGDHQQLKPHMECYDLEYKFKANISLFERLVKNGLEYVTLKYQRRMKSKFADFIRLIYSDYLDHTQILEQNKIHLEGFKSDLLFFDHRQNEDQKLYSSSKQNKFEAGMIIRMTDYMLKNGIKGNQITILTTYIRQALYIQKQINNKGIKVQAVDNYQGEENDIILLSLVRSNSNYKLGFVAIDNRICVALSRARLGFFVFGNFDFIRECIKDELQKNPQQRNPDISDLWLKILNLAKEKGVIQNFIELECSSHNQITKISQINDWNMVKNGGCTKVCNAQFPCGHICQKICHKSDHNQRDCLEQCSKLLICGHQCLGQCNQTQCPPCKYLIEKTIEKCGHKTKIHCHLKNSNVLCREKCEKILKCGHQCSLKCMDDCQQNKCLEQIQYKLAKCGHLINIICEDLKYVDRLICSEKCTQQQICGHNCSGSCGKCFDKFHKPCIEKCSKQLICGHKCQKLCSQECYQCEDQCQMKCNCQIRCNKKCYQECFECQKLCVLRCEHSKCTKKCYEQCDRQPCNQKCSKTLNCGCKCMGLCGEVCPDICLDKDHQTKFATNDTIFYQLECQCQFIAQVDILDQHFNNQQESLFHCPKCNQIIWNSSRYQKQVKQSLQWLNDSRIQAQMKYDVTNDKILNAIDLLQTKLDYVKQHKLKDDDGFLDNILQELKIESKLQQQGKDSKMKYNYLKCIKKQLQLYEKSVLLKNCHNDSQAFQFHKHNLINEYLMSEDYRKQSSKPFWWKITIKLESLLLYQEFLTKFQNTQLKIYVDKSYEIEDLNFFLDEEKQQDLKNILNKPHQQ